LKHLHCDDLYIILSLSAVQIYEFHILMFNTQLVVLTWYHLSVIGIQCKWLKTAWLLSQQTKNKLSSPWKGQTHDILHFHWMI